MKVLAFVLIVALGGLLGYSLAQDATQSDRIAAKVNTVRVTKEVVRTITDTVIRYKTRVVEVKARSDSTSAVVTLHSDSTVIIRDTVREAPPELIADNRALRITVATQDTLLRWHDRKDTAQLAEVVALRDLVAAQKPDRCGKKCGYLLGVLSSIAVYKAIK